MIMGRRKACFCTANRIGVPGRSTLIPLTPPVLAKHASFPLGVAVRVSPPWMVRRSVAELIRVAIGELAVESWFSGAKS
jgi:hypothetical protein